MINSYVLRCYLANHQELTIAIHAPSSEIAIDKALQGPWQHINDPHIEVISSTTTLFEKEL